MKKFIETYKKLPFLVHPFFIIFGIFAFIFGSGFAFLLYTLAVFLHELGHMLVARKRGYKMQQICLMPYGAVLYGDTDEFSCKDEIIIAIAGPITNFLLCGLCLVFWWLVPASFNYLCDFCIASLIAGVFNLLPIFPLDGGRVVLALLSDKSERKTSVKFVKLITIIFSIILFVIFLASSFYSFNISIGIASLFLFYSAIATSKEAKYERITLMFLRNKQYSHGLARREYLVSDELKLSKLLSMQSKAYIIKYIVVNAKGEKVFELGEEELEKLIEKNGINKKLQEILR